MPRVAKRKSEDPLARAVLEALAGVGRCPDCGSAADYMAFQGHRAARCQNGIKYCRVVYYRPDGLCIRVGDDMRDPITGRWVWSK